MNDNVVKLSASSDLCCLPCLWERLGGSSPRRDTTLSMSNL
jgi:hypothetical protein